MSEEIKTPEEGKDVVENNVGNNTESNIVVESIEDDYKALGIEPEVKQESKEEDKPSSTIPKEDANTEVKPARKSRSQRRIERLAREKQELEERVEALEKQESKPQVKEEAKPDAEDFETFEEYESALEEFNKPAEKVEEIPKQPKSDARIADMMEDGTADYENFNELVGAADLALTQPVLEEVLDAESPSDVAYYLATYKDKTKKIAKLSGRGIAREILKIELELEKKPIQTVRTTSAPEPISPLDGGSEKVRTAENATDFNEYQKLRSQQANKSGW